MLYERISGQGMSMKAMSEKKLALVRSNPVLDSTYLELCGGVSCRAVEYDDDEIVNMSIEDLTREFFCDAPSLNIMNVVVKNLPPSVLSPFSVYIVDVRSNTKSSSSTRAMHRFSYYYNARSYHGQERSGVECFGVCKEIDTETCLRQLDPTGKHLRFLEICERSMRAGVDLRSCQPFRSSSDMETFVRALCRQEISLTLKCSCLTDHAAQSALVSFLKRGIPCEESSDSTENTGVSSTLEVAINKRSMEECEEYLVKTLSQSVLSAEFWSVDDLGHGQAAGVITSEICSLVERDRGKSFTEAPVLCFVYPHPYSDTMKEICQGIVRRVADLKIVTSRRCAGRRLNSCTFVVVLDVFGDFECVKGLALELSRMSSFMDRETTRVVLIGGRQTPMAISWPNDRVSWDTRRSWQQNNFIAAVLSVAGCLSLGYTGDVEPFPGCAEFHSGKTRVAVRDLLVEMKTDACVCSWTTRSLLSRDKKRKFSRWNDCVSSKSDGSLNKAMSLTYPWCLSDTEYLCRKGQRVLLPNGDSVYLDSAPVFCEILKKRTFSVRSVCCQDSQSYKIVASKCPPLCAVSLHYQAYHSKVVEAYKT